MDSGNGPRNRGPNVGVSLCLGQFTDRFFATLGSKVQFNGPGPLDVSWHSCTTSEHERFAIDYLAKELFSKFDDGVKTDAKRERAISKFYEGETSCALTNAKFAGNAGGQVAFWLDPDSLEPEMEDQREVFNLARKHIGRVLGAFPGWDAVLGGMDFGPGATTRLARRRSGQENKWAGRPHVTPLALGPLAVVFDDLPLLKKRLQGPGCEIVPGNKLEWVPKNYKTDRTIAVEPDWNMYLQKGLGTYIRRRLKRVKIDLDNQEVNRLLALVGSIDGTLATLDLSMASDTVAYRLVEFLLRPDWFQALSSVRSEVGFYKANPKARQQTAVFYEKFSSMGNGFTFELETLIFWGILRAVSELAGETDHRLYVYGDDIVVPTPLAGHAMYYLKAAGFHINPDKSFASGPFRESCGGHYFQGNDVTPFYVREPVDNLDRLFLLHNNVYRWFSRLPGICDPGAVRDLLGWVRSFAPPKWRRPRLMGLDVGDGAFIGSFDEVCPRAVGKSSRFRGWEGWRAEVLTFRPKADTRPHECSDFLCAGQCSRAFPQDTNPDLPSLYKLERKRPELTHLRRWDPDVVRRLGALDSVAARASNVPDESRFWYVGVQVLPLHSEESWWKLT